MIKNGNKISQLLKDQGFDWHDYGRCSLRSGKNYLSALVNSHTENHQLFEIYSVENGTYYITNGIMNPKYHAYVLFAENIQEHELFKVFRTLIQENVNLSNLEG